MIRIVSYRRGETFRARTLSHRPPSSPLGEGRCERAEVLVDRTAVREGEGEGELAATTRA